MDHEGEIMSDDTKQPPVEWFDLLDNPHVSNQLPWLASLRVSSEGEIVITTTEPRWVAQIELDGERAPLDLDGKVVERVKIDEIFGVRLVANAQHELGRRLKALAGSSRSGFSQSLLNRTRSMIDDLTPREREVLRTRFNVDTDPEQLIETPADQAWREDGLDVELGPRDETMAGIFGGQSLDGALGGEYANSCQRCGERHPPGACP